MSQNSDSSENNNESQSSASKAGRNKIIALIVGVLVLAGVIIVPRVWDNFHPKEVSCLQSQTQIYEKYKDAVVLVKHTYAFQISIKGSEPFQIAVGDNLLEETTISGTGFFVSEDGKIVTNHHVAEPWKYFESKEDEMDELKKHIAAVLPDSINADYKDYLELHWDEYNPNEDNEAVSEVEMESEEESTVVNADSVKAANETKELLAENIALDKEISSTKLDDISIVPQTVEISVALHGSNNIWLPCTVFTIADTDEVDVAVLQLVNKTLPVSVANIIDLDDAIQDDSSLKPGTNAILIGYPLGMQIANTRKGIKVQVYEGQINKESDGVNLQYNVISTHGASGSPVFNECGQLIAVNYAGYEEAQGYNFGIVAKHAMALLD